MNSFPLNPEDLVVESFTADLDEPIDNPTRTRTEPFLSCRVDCTDGQGC